MNNPAVMMSLALGLHALASSFASAWLALVALHHDLDVEWQ